MKPVRATCEGPVGLLHTNVRYLVAKMDALPAVSRPYAEPSAETPVPSVRPTTVLSNSDEGLCVS